MKHNKSAENDKHQGHNTVYNLRYFYIVLLIICATINKVKGQGIPTGASPAPYVDAGRSHLYDLNAAPASILLPVVRITVSAPGYATSNATAILTSPTDWVSNGHPFFRSTPNGTANISGIATVTISTWENALTSTGQNPGTVLSGTNVEVHPSYGGPTGSYFNLDLSRGKLSAALENVKTVTAADFGDGLVAGEIYQVAGYSMTANVFQTPVDTGNVSAFNSKAIAGMTFLADAASYDVLQFLSSEAGTIPLYGSLLQIGSGSKVMSSDGKWQGIGTAISSSTPLNANLNLVLSSESSAFRAFATPVPDPKFTTLGGFILLIGSAAWRRSRNHYFVASTTANLSDAFKNTNARSSWI
jgi:hypothetical protein